MRQLSHIITETLSKPVNEAFENPTFGKWFGKASPKLQNMFRESISEVRNYAMQKINPNGKARFSSVKDEQKGSWNATESIESFFNRTESYANDFVIWVENDTMIAYSVINDKGKDKFLSDRKDIKNKETFLKYCEDKIVRGYPITQRNAKTRQQADGYKVLSIPQLSLEQRLSLHKGEPTLYALSKSLSIEPATINQQTNMIDEKMGTYFPKFVAEVNSTLELYGAKLRFEPKAIQFAISLMFGGAGIVFNFQEKNNKTDDYQYHQGQITVELFGGLGSTCDRYPWLENIPKNFDFTSLCPSYDISLHESSGMRTKKKYLSDIKKFQKDVKKLPSFAAVQRTMREYVDMLQMYTGHNKYKEQMNKDVFDALKQNHSMVARDLSGVRVFKTEDGKIALWPTPSYSISNKSHRREVINMFVKVMQQAHGPEVVQAGKEGVIILKDVLMSEL